MCFSHLPPWPASLQVQIQVDSASNSLQENSAVFFNIFKRQKSLLIWELLVLFLKHVLSPFSVLGVEVGNETTELNKMWYGLIPKNFTLYPIGYDESTEKHSLWNVKTNLVNLDRSLITKLEFGLGPVLMASCPGSRIINSLGKK